MHKLVFILLAVSFSCSQGKVKNTICIESNSSHAIDSIKNIEYSEDHFLDLYKPKSPSARTRPLVIMAHGMGDTKETPDLTFHSKKFAEKGLIVACVQWNSVSNFKIDTSLYFQTGPQPLVEIHQAINFLFEGARAENEFNIDTTQLFVGGSSFGAISALHIGFVDSIGQFPEQFEAELVKQGMTDESWKKIQTKIKGVINFAGWIWNLDYIDSIDPSLISIHGTDDPLVPFDSDTAYINGTNIMLVHGPKVIHERMESMALNNDLFIVPGGGHLSYYNKDWRDSVSNSVFNHIHELVCK